MFLALSCARKSAQEDEEKLLSLVLGGSCNTCEITDANIEMPSMSLTNGLANLIVVMPAAEWKSLLESGVFIRRNLQDETDAAWEGRTAGNLNAPETQDGNAPAKRAGSTSPTFIPPNWDFGEFWESRPTYVVNATRLQARCYIIKGQESEGKVTLYIEATSWLLRADVSKSAE